MTGRIPLSVDALERIWTAFPISVVWWWGQTGELPTLSEVMDAREAEATER
jgi:hypothetical protein